MSGISFLEWKKQKQAKEAQNDSNDNSRNSRPYRNREFSANSNPNIPSLLDLNLFGPRRAPQRPGPNRSMGPPFGHSMMNDYFTPYDTPLPPGDDDFFIPQQQPLQVQNISNPFKPNYASNDFCDPSANRRNRTYNGGFQFDKKRRFNNNKNTNPQGKDQNAVVSKNSSSVDSTITKSDAVVIKDEPKQNGEQLIGPNLPASKKKKKKNNNNWKPKPKEPPPINFDGPNFISKEERKAQWKAYRDAMKPFKYRPFLNAKREIQRLGKRDRSTLDERELNRLTNAEQFVAAHKAYLSLKKGANTQTWVKADEKPSESGSDNKLGEVYVLQPGPLVINNDIGKNLSQDAGNRNGLVAPAVAETTLMNTAQASKWESNNGNVPSITSNSSVYQNYFVPGGVLKHN